MATKKEKYESMRIMSLEGSVLYKNEGFTALKNGKPNPGAFRGVLDESLDTLKLAEIYERHEDEIGYPYHNKWFSYSIAGLLVLVKIFL